MCRTTTESPDLRNAQIDTDQTYVKSRVYNHRIVESPDNGQPDPDQTTVKTRMYANNTAPAKQAPTRDHRQEHTNGTSDTNDDSIESAVECINVEHGGPNVRKVTQPNKQELSVTFQGKKAHAKYPSTDEHNGHEKDKDNENDDLSGFVVSGHKRQRYAPLFVAGILLKNDSIDDTIECVNKHVRKRGFDVRGIWKIKRVELHCQ